MHLKSLEMRAKHVVEGFMTGLNRSPYHGFSVEFTEYRQYTQGDDLRHLDWKLFARSDRYYIKRFEDETNLRCLLLLDDSRSMNFGSRGYSKSEYARTLAATLGYFLNTQRDAVGLAKFSSVRSFMFSKILSCISQNLPCFPAASDACAAGCARLCMLSPRCSVAFVFNEKRTRNVAGSWDDRDSGTVGTNSTAGRRDGRERGSPKY